MPLVSAVANVRFCGIQLKATTWDRYGRNPVGLPSQSGRPDPAAPVPAIASSYEPLHGAPSLCDVASLGSRSEWRETTVAKAFADPAVDSAARGATWFDIQALIGLDLSHDARSQTRWQQLPTMFPDNREELDWDLAQDHPTRGWERDLAPAELAPAATGPG